MASIPYSLQLRRQWKPAAGIIAALSAVNHKTIGKLYVVTGIVFFALGGVAALLMRIQLMFPENTFLDADKKSYPQYLEQALRIVRKGGLVLVDNAFAFGQLFEEKPSDSEAGAVQAFNAIDSERIQSNVR